MPLATRPDSLNSYGPEPVEDNRVHEAGEEGGVDQVGNELRSFTDGAAVDSSGCDCERPLVEKITVIKELHRHVLKAEKVPPDETVGRCSEGQREAEEVVEEAAAAASMAMEIVDSLNSNEGFIRRNL